MFAKDFIWMVMENGRESGKNAINAQYRHH